MLSLDRKRELVTKLSAIGAIQFGEFTFKSGVLSPIYCDLRLFISHPRFLRQVAEIYADMLMTLEFDRMAGIPYAALPITAAVALEINEPWIFPRKEVKAYGGKKLIEGKFEKNDTIVVIDDVITKGDSKIEALVPLEEAGLRVKDFVVLIDYEKGGSQLLRDRGYELHSAITMQEIKTILLQESIIDQAMGDRVDEFLRSEAS